MTDKQRSDLKILKVRYCKPSIDLNATNIDGWSVFMYACYKGQKDGVQLLIHWITTLRHRIGVAPRLFIFEKNPPTTRLFATLISRSSKIFQVNFLNSLSGNTKSFEISVYLLHFTLLRLFIAWDLSSTTLIRCTTAIRYFRVRHLSFGNVLLFINWITVLHTRWRFFVIDLVCVIYNNGQ